MEDINRLKVVLAEKKRTAKWLATEIGKDSATTMQQFAQNATDIAYYVEKMQQALDFKNQNLSTRDIILKVASKHISNHGRIIDGDLSMIISAASKVTELPLDTDLEWSGMDIVMKNYRDKVFFTRYAFGMEPTLVPALEY